MYVKVHNKGRQWFRDDGTLVGIEVLTSHHISASKSTIIKDDHDRYFAIIRGKVNENGNFIPSCNSTICNDRICSMKCTPICFLTNNHGCYIVSD